MAVAATRTKCIAEYFSPSAAPTAAHRLIFSENANTAVPSPISNGSATANHSSEATSKSAAPTALPSIAHTANFADALFQRGNRLRSANTPAMLLRVNATILDAVATIGG